MPRAPERLLRGGPQFLVIFGLTIRQKFGFETS